MGRREGVVLRKKDSPELLEAQRRREKEDNTTMFDALALEWEWKKISEDEGIIRFCRQIEKKFEERRPKLENFRDLPEAATDIDADLALVAEKRNRIAGMSAEDDRNYDNVLLDRYAEFVIMHALEDGIITPEDVEIVPGSEYDDLFRGVDVVIPFYDKQTGEFSWQFSIDVKAGTSGVSKAVQEIARKIVRGIPLGAKYHRVKNNVEDNEFVLQWNIEMPNVLVVFEKAVLKAFLWVLSQRKVPLEREAEKRFERLKEQAFKKIKRLFFESIRAQSKAILTESANSPERRQELSEASKKQYERIISWAEKNLAEQKK